MNRLDQLHGHDPYALMGLKSNADDATIKRAYKRNALLCHPDKFLRKSEQEQLHAKTIFERLTAARDVLLDNTARAAYDLASHRCPRCPHNQLCFCNPDGRWSSRCARCTPRVPVLPPPPSQNATIQRACQNVRFKMEKLDRTIAALDEIIRKNTNTMHTLTRKRKRCDREYAAAKATVVTHSKKRTKAYHEYKNLAATNADLELHVAELQRRSRGY